MTIIKEGTNRNGNPPHRGALFAMIPAIRSEIHAHRVIIPNDRKPGLASAHVLSGPKVALYGVLDTLTEMRSGGIAPQLKPGSVANTARCLGVITENSSYTIYYYMSASDIFRLSQSTLRDTVDACGPFGSD